jgi:hypothetical protein
VVSVDFDSDALCAGATFNSTGPDWEIPVDETIAGAMLDSISFHPDTGVLCVGCWLTSMAGRISVAVVAAWGICAKVSFDGTAFGRAMIVSNAFVAEVVTGATIDGVSIDVGAATSINGWLAATIGSS